MTLQPFGKALGRLNAMVLAAAVVGVRVSLKALRSLAYWDFTHA